MGKKVIALAIALGIGTMLVACAYRPVPGGERATTYRPEASAGEVAR